MAGPTQETKATISFKKLVGKAQTSNDKPFYSESIPSQISIDASEVLGEQLPTDPQAAVDNGLGEYVELDLQPIAASNGLAYNLRFPSSYSGNFGTGVQGDLVRNETQIIDQKNNRQDGLAASDNSGGYVYDLKDGTGQQIPEGASENWQLDPVAGIIVSEVIISELQNNGGTVGVYLYTGDTLDEAITGIEGGNLAVEDSTSPVSSSVKTINFGNLLDVTGSGDTVTANLNGDLSNYDFSNISTDDLPEGSNNRYFTDERAQDAVGTIVEGSNGVSVTYTDEGTGSPKIDIDGSGAAASVSNGGTQVVGQATDLNFGRNITASDDGDGTATIVSDVKLNSATFDGDGIQKEFQIAHGLTNAPDAWTVHATTDDASGISHSTADATNITIVYDTAPPSGTNNIKVNYVYEE